MDTVHFLNFLLVRRGFLSNFLITETVFFYESNPSIISLLTGKKLSSFILFIYLQTTEKLQLECTYFIILCIIII